MVAGRLAEEADAVVDAAALRVLRAVVEPADAGKRDCRRAHGAGFERDIEIGAGKPFVADDPRRRADHLDLGMGGDIVELAGSGFRREAIALPSRTTTAPIGTSPRVCGPLRLGRAPDP